MEDTTSVHDSLSMEAFEMRFNQLHVDNLQAEVGNFKTSLEEERSEKEEEEDDVARKEELGFLLGRVESASASLSYLRSKVRILAVLGLTHLPFDDDTLKGSSKSHDSFTLEMMLESIEMVSDVFESLLRKVRAAETERCLHKERVVIGEEEIRRKTVEIEDLTERLEEMKRIVIGNKTVLDETVEIIKRLVEESRRDREKAMENEEELRRMKTECESLRNYVNASTNVIETILSSEQQFQNIERLVAKSAQLEGEKAQKEVEVQKLMEENVKLTALLDKKEAQLLALNEQCKVMALNTSNI